MAATNRHENKPTRMGKNYRIGIRWGVTVRGFRSIREAVDPITTGLNVLIGPNGVGKSNLLEFFRFVRWIVDGELQMQVAKSGGASRFLHHGPERTTRIEGELRLGGGINWSQCYRFVLSYDPRDIFLFESEEVEISIKGQPSYPWRSSSSGYTESVLRVTPNQIVNGKHIYIPSLAHDLGFFRVYEALDTSKSAPIRGKCAVDDGIHLLENGGNLAAHLLYMRNLRPDDYNQVLHIARQYIHSFVDLELVPEDGLVSLNWVERGSRKVYGPDHLSGGGLRLLFLLSLLCDPPTFPLILESPELNLHPEAVKLIGKLLKRAQEASQIIVTTQSPILLDQIDPDDVMIVETKGSETIFQRKSKVELEEWIRKSSRHELWYEKLLGSKP